MVTIRIGMIPLLVLVACATRPPVSPAETAEGDLRSERSPAEDPASPDAGLSAVEVPPADSAEDRCAAFNREQANRLSDAEHQRIYGCPPCPCACVDGEIRCAPCAHCDPVGPPSPPPPPPSP